MTKKVAEGDFLSNSISFDVTGIDFDAWCIAYPLQETENQPYTDENGDTINLTTTTGGEITIACNNGSEFYYNEGIASEFIVLTMSDTNLKGV